MTPKEKAKELVEKYIPYARDWDIEKYAILNAKQCALIAVDEIINDLIHIEQDYSYWQEVKREIKLL
jgi:hypothetical protein